MNNVLSHHPPTRALMHVKQFMIVRHVNLKGHAVFLLLLLYFYSYVVVGCLIYLRNCEGVFCLRPSVSLISL